MGSSSQRSRRRRRPSTKKTAAPEAGRSPLLLKSGEATAAAALAGFVLLFVAIALLATGGTGFGDAPASGAPADEAAAITPDDAAATSDPGTATETDLPTAADDLPTAAATDVDQPTATAAAPDDYQPTAIDEEEIRTLARRSIEVLPAGQWPSLYDSFTSEFQQRCPREEFDQAGVDAGIELGADLRLLRFIRLESATFEGSSAQAVITGEIAGQDEYQVQAAFQREASAWKIAPLPGTQGCQAFLSS